MISSRSLCSLAVCTLGLTLPMGAIANEPADQVEFFEKKIRPVLVEHCYRCHSTQAPKLKAGLLLDTREGVRKGGETGPTMVVGKPAESLLIKALRYDSLQMPPAGKLPESVIRDFETWIAKGAADPRAAVATATAPASPSMSREAIDAGRKFWSFQPPKAHSLPMVRNKTWPKGRIDHFLLAAMEKAGLEPSQPAERRTWIRRATFDLIGLPPTPEEVETFVNDKSSGAHERVVDRLLASPHYGERWARLWLDVARFAEDQAHIVGKDISLTYPNAYLYRDWVIQALNKDVPYDQFVRLQLAGDLMEPEDESNRAGLGFLGLGPKYYQRKSIAVMADEWEDRVDVVTRGLMGLTAACARCHDHKFDPIPTEDYYALAGVFASTSMFNRPLSPMTDGKDDPKDPTKAMHIVKEATPTDLNIFIRGNANTKGPMVPRHFLQVLSSGEAPAFREGSGRKELADAVVNPSNPLTARVMVNRVWASLFGKGLVGTPSNFGTQGEKPSHPELLDDLSVRFVQNGWSLKRLVRELVLSAAYGQTTDERVGESVDAENRLLSHMNRRRLSVEQWRDAVLAASGRLENAIGGKSINPQDAAERRRTVYSAVSRLDLNRMLSIFDYPDPNLHAATRVETTTPLQKLFMMNSPFMTQQAAFMAERLGTEATDETGARKRIEQAYSHLFGRPANEQEVTLGIRFLREGGFSQARWQQYAHVLLASNEMMFLD